jgi:hypothetical protein
MKCIQCNKKAEYIYKGYSFCKEHAEEYAKDAHTFITKYKSPSLIMIEQSKRGEDWDLTPRKKVKK